jgi:hypothetical protein
MVDLNFTQVRDSVFVQSYDKNEKMPILNGKRFQAHAKEGICIQFSPKGNFLVTSGDK